MCRAGSIAKPLLGGLRFVCRCLRRLAIKVGLISGSANLVKLRFKTCQPVALGKTACGGAWGVRSGDKTVPAPEIALFADEPLSRA